MIDWLHGLPFVWLVVVVFGATYLVAATISWVVLRLAVGERARAFKPRSPGLLPPLGVVFGLVVVFLAVQVWNDVGQAQTAVRSPRSKPPLTHGESASSSANRGSTGPSGQASFSWHP
jgi:hypothetical protein